MVPWVHGKWLLNTEVSVKFWALLSVAHKIFVSNKALCIFFWMYKHYPNKKSSWDGLSVRTKTDFSICAQDHYMLKYLCSLKFAIDILKL